jgi:uncharacterized protein YjdB
VSNTGLIKGVQAGGPVNITATCPDDTSKTAVVAVTVDNTVTGISVSPETASVGTGKTTTLTATVTPSTTFEKVEWATSDATIAKVNGGVVTGVKAGNATITATCGGQSGTCAITVVDATAAPTVSPSTTTNYVAIVGETAKDLIVTATEAAGTTGGTFNYQWYSKSSTGTITKVGTNSSTYTPSTSKAGATYYYCTVTDTVNGVVSDPTTSGTFTLTVSPLYSGTVSSTSDNVKVGSSTSLKATIYQNSVNSTYTTAMLRTLSPAAQLIGVCPAAAALT